MVLRPLETVRDVLPVLRRDRDLVAIADALSGAVAIEPGGPSALFGKLGLVPVYSRLAALDTLDFNENTIWSGASKLPANHRRTVIGEARHMTGVDDNSYDALLASHVIEHTADPIGALREWQRVVRPEGHILLIVPHRDGTFDHRRPITTVEHMLSDEERQTGEDDLTHLDEILELHDLGRDPGAGSCENFERRSRANAKMRALHHHVFDTRSVVAMCEAAGLEVLRLRPKPRFNIVCLARVVPDSPAASRDPVRFSEQALARELARSPFPSDRSSA